MTHRITSRRNPRIVASAALGTAKGRRASQRTLIEGPRLLGDAVAAGAELPVVYCLDDDEASVGLAGRSGAEIVFVTPEVLGRLATTDTPRGPIAELVVPPPAAIGRADTVVLWDVSDPGNAGTLIRTAAALGFEVAVVGGVDVWSPKVLRSASGGHFRTGLGVFDADIAAVAAAGLLPVALVVDGGVAPEDGLAGEPPIALLLGSEAHGLPAAVAEAAVVRVTISLAQGNESLNVAAAGAIAMYVRHEARRG